MQTKIQALKENDYIVSDFKEEFETLEFFMLKCPFVTPMLDNIAVTIIFGGLCKGCLSKEEVVSKLKEVKDSPNDYKGKYQWKNISLVDLFNMDYNNLIKYNLIKKNLVPDEKFFVEKFYYKEKPKMIYPFSLKEYFPVFLSKKIESFIDVYFNSLKYKEEEKIKKYKNNKNNKN